MPDHHPAQPMQQPSNHSWGFSLLELMVVLVVLGLLSAIAYPRYTEQWARSKRAEARIALFENAQFLENHRASHGHYGNTLHSNTAPTLPVAQLPRQNGSPYYALSVQVDDQHYTLQAIPVGTMSSDPCQRYQIDHTGATSLWQDDTEITDAALLHSCWNQ